MNGESTSMVWPTLGSRTAKEQEQNRVQLLRAAGAQVNKLTDSMDAVKPIN